LSWSHFAEVVNIPDQHGRHFYTVAAARERWSVRTLRERITSKRTTTKPSEKPRSACSPAPTYTIRSAPRGSPSAPVPLHPETRLRRGQEAEAPDHASLKRAARVIGSFRLADDCEAGPTSSCRRASTRADSAHCLRPSLKPC
jgi:hypothetical protein